MSSYLGFQPTTSSKYYFVSYGSDDASRVGPVVCALSQKLPLWYDYGLVYGEDWKKNIADHIENAEGVLLFVSKKVFARGNDSYVYTEYQMAKDFYNKPIIIIQIEDIVKSDIPNELVGWWIELNRYQNIIRHAGTTDESLANLIYKAVVKDEKSRAKSPEESPERQTIDIRVAADALLKRAFMYLEDGEWENADKYCERVLDLNPENAEAYLGKLMAALKINHQEDLADCDQPFDNNTYFRKAIQFGDEKLKEILNGYITHIKKRNENARLTELYNKAVGIMNSANASYQFQSAADIFKSIAGFRDADALAKQCLNNADIARKNAIYNSARAEMEKNTIDGYKEAIQLFGKILGWEDADSQISLCRQNLEKLEEQQEQVQKAVEVRTEAERKAKEQKKRIVFAVVSVIALVVIISAVSKSNSKKSDNTSSTSSNSYYSEISYERTSQGESSQKELSSEESELSINEPSAEELPEEDPITYSSLIDWEKYITVPTKEQTENRKSIDYPDVRFRQLNFPGIDSDDSISGYCIDLYSDYHPSGTKLMPIVFSFMDPTGNYKFSETECLFEFQSDGSCLFTLDFQGASQGSYLDNPDETIIEIEPEVVYPKDPDTYSATVIGSNGEYTIPFDWQPDRYYRILLQLIPSEITQNALFSVKICDLSSNTWTNLFEIDTSVSEVAMKNNFEGWMLGSSDDAENRSMVISNIRALPYGANKDGWVYAENVELQIYDSGLYGSYFFTTKGSSILMFATGIRNVWDLPDSSSTYPLEPGDTSPPYN